MSVLLALRDTQERLHDAHQDARSRWRDGGEGGEVTGEEDGISVRMAYEGSSRSTDFRSVHLDGVLFARESETVPWNIFKHIVVGYTVYLDLTLKKAEAMIGLIEPVGRVSLEPEWYPSETGPLRYYAHCNEFADVLALWKVWKPRYLK